MLEPPSDNFANTDGTCRDEGECLRCYLERQLSQFPCDGSLRWTREWVLAHAPQEADMVDELEGLDCCDGEVLSAIVEALTRSNLN